MCGFSSGKLLLKLHHIHEYLLVFVIHVPKGLLKDSRSYNGGPPNLTFNHGFPVIRLSRPKEIEKTNAISALLQEGGSGTRTPDLLRRRSGQIPQHQLCFSKVKRQKLGKLLDLSHFSFIIPKYPSTLLPRCSEDIVTQVFRHCYLGDQTLLDVFLDIVRGVTSPYLEKTRIFHLKFCNHVSV